MRKHRPCRGRRDYAYPHNFPRHHPLPRDESPVADARFVKWSRIKWLRQKMRGHRYHRPRSRPLPIGRIQFHRSWSTWFYSLVFRPNQEFL